MKQRLQKVIAQAGIASRRKAEELILEGKVKVSLNFGDFLNLLKTKAGLLIIFPKEKWYNSFIKQAVNKRDKWY